MGGKGSSNIQPYPSSSSSSSDDNMMALLVQMLMSSQSEPEISTPTPLELPEIEPIADFDWAEKQKELEQMVKVSQAADARRRKGHADTLHAPLLDDEDSKTTSLLGS